MSFFLYNQNAQQAIARPFLDGKAATGAVGLARWLCDPYTLKFQLSYARHAIRWFVGN